MANSFIGFNEELRKRIRKDMNDIADHVDTGGCKDWGEYLKLTSQITGLAMAERHLLDLIEAAEKE